MDGRYGRYRRSFIIDIDLWRVNTVAIKLKARSRGCCPYEMQQFAHSKCLPVTCFLAYVIVVNMLDWALESFSFFRIDLLTVDT